MLSVAFADDLYGSVLVQQPHSSLAHLADHTLHRLPHRDTFKAGEVQVLRETIIPEVALLERRTTFADERIAEHGNLTDAGENPRQQVVPLKYLPRDTEALARLLKTRPKRPHAPILPGRFSWTIQRLL